MSKTDFNTVRQLSLCDVAGLYEQRALVRRFAQSSGCAITRRALLKLVGEAE